jgi:hypothetical protein
LYGENCEYFEGDAMQKAIKSISPLFILVLAVLSARALGEQPCLQKAWNAYNHSDYTRTIDFTNECIDQFSARALRDENALETSYEKEPPTGSVDSSFDRKKIFERWAVNDVSTAYFVRGQAAERLYKQHKKSEYMRLAKESYSAAARLKFGRCWDPQGWFWSPPDSSAERLAVLK